MSTESSYELSREHEEFRRTVRAFAEAEIAPHAAQWDRDHHFPVDVVRKMGALGLFGLTAPEEYGGAGEDGHRARQGKQEDRETRGAHRSTVSRLLPQECTFVTSGAFLRGLPGDDPAVRLGDA